VESLMVTDWVLEYVPPIGLKVGVRRPCDPESARQDRPQAETLPEK
jgi:hypothetical protein